jgi:prephenate dehydrogenase
MRARPLFNKAAVIGVGLIGGSLAIVLREKGLANKIVGIGRGLRNLKEAKRLGIVDEITQDLAEGVTDADLIVIAVPVLKTKSVVEEALPHIKRGAILTDVGSVKKDVIDAIEPMLPKGVNFVPGHPVAGTENSGAGAAMRGLFKGRRCILTPTKRTGRKALSVIRRLWQEAGSEVVTMDAREHDRVLAAVSHLPHVIAYELVNTVSDAEARGGAFLKYSAGGFKDFTRIASSSPEMWADICSMNRRFIVEMIRRYEKRLKRARGLMDSGDWDSLCRDFAKAKSARDALIKETKR